jgi:hypothetical protein
MYRKSFTDCYGKKGTVGTKVIEHNWGKDFREPLEVKEIMSRGAGGTKIGFVGKFGVSPAKGYRILD